MWVLSFAVIVCGMFKLVSPECPEECRCSAAAPRCAPGVPVVADRCSCCVVCARQLNQDCSRMQPCDHARGLKCNFGAGYGAAAHGVCRAKSEGRSCEYNGRIYQNGESFRPNCRHRCTCMDAAVSCVSLCPHKVALLKPDCEKHRSGKSATGRCCERPAACPDEGGKRRRLLLRLGERGPRGTPKSRNDEMALVSIGAYSSLAAFTREPEGHMLVYSGPRRCRPQSGAWSPCSASCGPGVSSRLSNSNGQCKPTRETRMCEVRPCARTSASTSSKGAGKCNPTEEKKAAGRAVTLSHMGCRSLKKFRLRFCGSCSQGLCCRPHRTRTAPVGFRCEDGRTFSHNVMIIQSCKCEPHNAIP